MKHILRLALLAMLAGAIATLPSPLAAQTTNKPASKKSAAQSKEQSKEGKKPGAHPFHGKLAELDKMAKTITIGKSVYLITSETKMTKAGKPATLGDGVVGEEVRGYAKPNEAGKMVATRLTFGPKGDANTAEKKSSSKKTEKP